MEFQINIYLYRCIIYENVTYNIISPYPNILYRHLGFYIQIQYHISSMLETCTLSTEINTCLY